MEVPFTVAFDPPSQAEPRVVFRLRRTWLAGLLDMLAIGSLFGVSSFGRAAANDVRLVMLGLESER